MEKKDLYFNYMKKKDLYFNPEPIDPRTWKRVRT